ncbi:hypothetical protein I553_10063 [Mycobacterium xenopi 4042]|uniref:Uncharacterized protein n=1 Tax=Mycobacterium xenopi 4042 TaxID=1299334 RepID=X7YQC7_MYCXE|nr:hypothetical protein I553_10063 [Mycobacterium xenopi 4042]
MFDTTDPLRATGVAEPAAMSALDPGIWWRRSGPHTGWSRCWWRGGSRRSRPCCATGSLRPRT